MSNRLLRNSAIVAALAVVVTLATLPAWTSASDPEPTGKLVVVPWTVQVGQTTLAVGFHVVPHETEVRIEYSKHFVPEGGLCDDASAGATPVSVAPQWIYLTACSKGTGEVRLVVSDTGNVIEEADVPITPAGPTGQQSPSSIALSVSPNKITVGGETTVRVDLELDASREYVLTTVLLNSPNAAFDRGCSDFEETDNIQGTASVRYSYTAYGCATPRAGVWAYTTVGGRPWNSATLSDSIAISDVPPTPVPPTPVPPTNAAPSGLDVTPLPGREARLSWDGVPGADGYVVEVRDPDAQGETPPFSNIWPTVVGTITCAASSVGGQEKCGQDIKLYDIFRSRGLTHAPYAYRFRVKTTDSEGLDNPYSEEITIIDNPIIRADGDSRDTDDGKGQAKLTWPDIDGANRYWLRFRKSSVDPTSDGWVPVHFEDSEERPKNGQAGDQGLISPYIIGDLERKNIYAIQLNYETDDGEVYSGQDVYVWPYTEAAHNISIAAIPLRHRQDRHYYYHICVPSFAPSNELWVPLITDALEEWETATDDLVLLRPIASMDCADYSPFTQRIESKVQEELTGSPSPVPPDSITTLIMDLLEEFRETGVLIPGETEEHLLGDVQMDDRSQNEIRGISLWTDSNQFMFKHGLLDIAEQFYPFCFAHLMETPRSGGGCAFSSSSMSRDILIGVVGELTSGPSVDNDFRVQFDTCLPHSYYYGLLVHEAGHILGAGHAVNDGRLDSVMNYGVIGGTIGYCSPSALDVLAIYALYQTDQPLGKP